MATHEEVAEIAAKVKESKANIIVTDHPDEAELFDNRFTGKLAAGGEDYKLDVFMIRANEDRTQVEVVLGNRAKVQAYPDASFRQVVFTVKEPERSTTRVITGMQDSRSRRAVRDDLMKGHRFPVYLPKDETTYKVDDLKHRYEDGGYGKHGVWDATITATTQPTLMCFLIGHDEHAMFVSRLPKIVKSVKAAHDALRPKGVPADAVRVGEFFLTPVSEATSVKLDRKVAQDPDAAIGVGDYDYDGTRTLTLGNDGENHIAATAVDLSGSRYVIGWVIDTEKRHDPLFLYEWCKVTPNLELDPPSGMESLNFD